MSDDSDYEVYDSQDTYYDDGDDMEDILMDDDDEDFRPPPVNAKGKQTDYEVHYESLTPYQLQTLIDDDIRHVAAIIGSEPPIVSILLRHFRWNRDRLLDRFMDSDVADILRAAGEPEHNAANSPTTNLTCEICFDTPSPEDTFQLRCHHRFCRECWWCYVTSKIKDEGQCTFGCMKDGCKTIVDEPSVRALVDEPCYDRYRTLIQSSYVTSHPTRLRFCPYPACTSAVSCSNGSGSSLLTLVPTVTCASGHAFCFGCGMSESHAPLPCKLAATWQTAAREDQGTAQWIKANTRNCPKCKNSIEKGGGCNRMTCRHCSYMFCWMCMRDWNVHGYNNEVCNIWNEPPPDENMTTASRNLQKWLFYYDHFTNHELSAQLEGELYERTAEKIVEMQDKSGISWIEAQFLRRAVDELSRCRATLKWTYAMAHFLAQGNKKQMLEDIQADLEKAVEQLAQLIEEPIEEGSVRDLRARVVDKMVYVQKRHEVVMKDTAAGLMEGSWDWDAPLE
ncbi:hypothetical protein PUNSTDRAFT_135502 [Punctularia strigosozonata HHB-11173 SS5]|uniref:uncharacterized protein n=1 Tax=Punctularia strigosozonata (strain HHB-11173) TaxID=741275 RepID=UPI0004416660|nr:uncharacterized protein PUNSTDRAFT_135502 [Punctularia strigosozonata HHB-11173 SS5]EIN07986.1 hypothetical protein PUNSTDRAFT_135502 [Punctularia strigosozonata HHB-11173 SS5]